MLRLAILLSCFSVATLVGQTQWTKYSGNPLISPGQINYYSCNGFDYWQSWMPTVLFENGIYRMWYVGDGYAPDRTYSFGYRISDDGVNWFSYEKNPVLLPGSSFDNQYMWGGTIVKDGTEYKLYYGGFSSTTQKWSVGLATSTDGIHWAKRPDPVLTGGGPGSWDVNGVSQPCVMKDGAGQYRMWFGGSTNQSTTAIGCATSTDGITWVEYSGNPILTATTANQWESFLVSDPRVVKVGSTYHMLYFGTPAAPTYQIGYASSSDGIQWSRYSGNPVVRLGQSGSWDDYSLSMHCVIWQDSTFKMWYAGRRADQIFQIGYATSPLGPTDVNPTKDLPEEFKLQQNYPNPFNPSTTLVYDVPGRSHITLKVYNTLGQEVTTLVDEERMAGSYSVVWDAQSVASGTYWTQMTADGKTVVQKMILLK